MKYMMLIYTSEHARAALSPEDTQKVIQGHWAVMDETARRGIFVAANPLAPTAAATTVRRDAGKVLITDGPFAETKEQLAGYYILDCNDLDEAIAWASKIPTCGGATGGIEIRPVQELPQPAARREPQAAAVNG